MPTGVPSAPTAPLGDTVPVTSRRSGPVNSSYAARARSAPALTSRATGTGDLWLLMSLGVLHRRQEALAELRRLVGGSAGLRGYVIVGHRRLPYAAGSIATRTAPSSGFQPATFSNSNPRCSTSSMRLRI